MLFDYGAGLTKKSHKVKKDDASRYTGLNQLSITFFNDLSRINNILAILSRSPLHKLGINRLSKTRESHREVNDGLPEPREDYFRLMQVRHPLERLASAYYSEVTKHDIKTYHTELVKEIRVRITTTKRYTSKLPLHICSTVDCF